MSHCHAHDVLRQRLLERAGLTDPPIPAHVDIDTLFESQWDTRFEQLMRNRLVMGFFRYGGLHTAERRARSHDNVGSAIARLRTYRETGNQEHLVDAANLCMVEFMVPSCHPRPGWRPTDDGPHTRRD